MRVRAFDFTGSPGEPDCLCGVEFGGEGMMRGQRQCAPSAAPMKETAAILRFMLLVY